MDYTIKVTTSDLLPVKEAAKEIGCTPDLMYHWIEVGRVIGLRFAGVLSVPVSEVERVKADSLLIKLRTNELLSIQNAAKDIGCSRSTMYHWIEVGRIISLLFGGVLYVPISEVKRVKAGPRLAELRQHQAVFQKAKKEANEDHS